MAEASQVRNRLIVGFAIATAAASAITALTTGLTIWISTLPAISPVSLSLAFRSWSRIIEFNLSIWLWTFFIASIAIALRFARWYWVDRMMGHRSPDY
jgi:hypothetical protein